MKQKDVRITIRVNEKQSEKLKQIAEESGYSVSEVLRDFISQDKQIIKKEDTQALISQINKIGNNLNQIAFRINSDNLKNKINNETYITASSRLLMIQSQLNIVIKNLKRSKL